MLVTWIQVILYRLTLCVQEILLLLTESRVPDAPRTVTVTPHATSIRVSWTTPPPENKIVVRGYVLGWGKGVPDSERKILGPDTQIYSIENLSKLTANNTKFDWVLLCALRMCALCCISVHFKSFVYVKRKPLVQNCFIIFGHHWT